MATSNALVSQVIGQDKQDIGFVFPPAVLLLLTGNQQ